MNSKVLKAGLGYTIGNYLLKGLVFFSIPIFARLLSPSDYGKYSIFVAYEAVFSVILSLAIFTSYKNARYKYRTREEGAEPGHDYASYRSTTLLFISGLFAIWLLVANVFSECIVRILGLDIFSINLLMIYSFSSAIITCFNVDMSLEYKFQNFLRVAVINAFTSISLSIILIETIFVNQRYMGRVVGTVLPVFVISCYLLLIYFKEAKPKNLKKFILWGVGYSIPIVPHGLSQIILNQFDRIMINYYVGAFQAGIYSFAYNMFAIISVTATSLDNVWGPWFYEKMNNKDYTTIYDRSKYMILLLFTLVTCIMLVSPELIGILGTQDYHEAVYCVLPLIAGGFFAYLYNIPAGVEYYHEKTQYIAIGTMSAAVINIILNSYVISRYDYKYVAYTTLFTYILYFVFHYTMAWHIQRHCLFPTNIVILSSVSVTFILVFTLNTINNFCVRWIAMLLIFGLSTYYAEKKIGIISTVAHKIRERI